MGTVSIIHTIIIPDQTTNEIGPCIYCRNSDVPNVIFCFNNVHADPNRRGKFTSDISILTEGDVVVSEEVMKKADSLIDFTFSKAIDIITENQDGN